MTALFVVLVGIYHGSSNNDVIYNLKFRQPLPLTGIPTGEVQKVFQDSDGFIWIGTRYGLCRYDGYQSELYKTDIYNPGMLSNNDVLSITEDNNRNIWIGTQEGINILEKETGKLKNDIYPQIKNTVVSCLLNTSSSEIWIGTDVGLYRHTGREDSLKHYAGENTGYVMPHAAIKSLFEDSMGDIWIGTWDYGLYRYSVGEDRFFRYPKMNDHNSAHVVYEDSRNNIWVGTWDEGLILLKDPRDMEHVSWKNFRFDGKDPESLLDNIVYALSEDTNTNTLWVGTRSGLSIMDMDKPGKFVNYSTGQAGLTIPSNEINSLLKDYSGNMWIGSIGGGVYMVDTSEPGFNLYKYNGEEYNIPTNSVTAIFVDDDQLVWLGVGSYGIAKHNRNTGKLIYYTRMPEFAGINIVPTVNTIIRRKISDELWFGTYDGGIYVFKKDRRVRHLTMENSGFIKYNCITALYEDRHGNCWVGTRYGAGVLLADGNGFLFNEMKVDGTDLERCYIKDIIEDDNGDIWIATKNYGIIRMSGDINFPGSVTYRNYSAVNAKMENHTVYCLFKDSKGRLWAGTAGGGLFLYDELTDRFESKSRHYRLTTDFVGSIEEDANGNLWLGTNNGLAKLNVPADGEAVLRVYTSADGLQDNFFIHQASSNNNGELFFGGYKGYNSFRGDEIGDNVPATPFYITDIKIFNKSLKQFASETRQRIAAKIPPYTERLKLPDKYNNFSVEFACLSFKRPELNRYAYKLEGFDENWQYTDATRRFAYYNNLRSGSYTFMLKTAGENGVWNDGVKTILVVVLPPFYATWWAYTIYFVILAAILFFIYKVAGNRMKLKNSLHLKELEKAKIEEVNHAKLQFFTNITHELLTPLTIITATVDELRMLAPGYHSLYSTMNNNVSRLIRLLRQILEFRKAETTNLKLKVSSGDITAFVKNVAESFTPLIRKRNISLFVSCKPDQITGYFDPDKLDKIIYNLLSNAAKYNKDGGFIHIDLSYVDDNSRIMLQVKDGGFGISKEKQKDLFRRFYDGDYRLANVSGTGIGLSLTKDLVELHGGNISVDSEPGNGSVFAVVLPVERSCFKPEDIEENDLYAPVCVYIPEVECLTPVFHDFIALTEEEPGNSEPVTPVAYSVLLVEDNSELRELMTGLLKRHYTLHIAANGKEAITVMENRNIDLVVSDIMMPEMDGLEFCKYVKSKIEFCHIPVILLTAKSKDHDRAEAYESDADAFISKPFNLNVLLSRIRNLLKQKQRIANTFKKQIALDIKQLDYTNLDEDFVKRAIECIKRHIDEPDFDQQQFVEEMGTSKSTLYNKLKSLTGLNTSAFIRNVRLKTACSIMKSNPSIRISELAYAVGFNDPKYFSLCFKKEFNMLPSEYTETINSGNTGY